MGKMLDRKNTMSEIIWEHSIVACPCFQTGSGSTSSLLVGGGRLAPPRTWQIASQALQQISLGTMLPEPTPSSSEAALSFGAGSAAGRLGHPTCSGTGTERERADIPQGASEGRLLQLRKIKLCCTTLLRLTVVRLQQAVCV